MDGLARSGAPYLQLSALSPRRDEAMDADDELSPPAVKLDDYGIPTRAQPTLRMIRRVLLTAFCLVCACVPVVMFFGYHLDKYEHLRLGLRLNVTAGGLVAQLPLFVMALFLRKRRDVDVEADLGLIVGLVFLAVMVCALLGIWLFAAGVIGSTDLCRRDCGSY
jgi:hypothetical protein